MYKELGDKNILYTDDDNKTRSIIPFYTPFIEQKRNIDRSQLYSIKLPFELLHGDVADISFFSKSTADPIYCFLISHCSIFLPRKLARTV